MKKEGVRAISIWAKKSHCMIFKENGRVGLGGWSMRWKHTYEKTMEDGPRRKAERRTLTVHLPTKAARDATRYYMIQSFPSNGVLVQKIDTLFKVIYRIFFPNTLKHKLPKSHSLVSFWIWGYCKQKSSQKRRQRKLKKGRDKGKCITFWSRCFWTERNRIHFLIFGSCDPQRSWRGLKMNFFQRMMRHFGFKNPERLYWPDGGYHSREVMKCSNSKLT